MNIDFLSVDLHHLPVDIATHPIAPPGTRLGVLLLLAGTSLLRRRAYPDALLTAHSGASN